MNTQLAVLGPIGLLCLLASCSIHRPGAPGQQDYSPKAMFMGNHGDFVLKANPWRPSLRGSVLLQPNNEVTGETGDFNLQHYSSDGSLRIYLDDQSYGEIGLEIGARRYEFSSTVPNGANDETLFTLATRFAGGRFLEDDFLLEIWFEPGVYSDLDSGTSLDDWQFFTGGLATYRYEPDIFFKAGIEHSRIFRDVPVYPLAGIAYVINDQWRIDALLPRQAEIRFLPTNETTLFAGLYLDGDEYRIRTPRSMVPAKVKRDVSVQEFRLAAGASFRFSDQLSFMLRGGTVLLGDTHFRDQTGEVYDGTLEPRLFIEAGFGWDF